MTPDRSLPDAGNTIYALSSGPPPAAVALVRVSGPGASLALSALAAKVPAPRRAALARLNDPDDGALIDHALVLWFPGPASVTGEDVAEFHLHGGRAVVGAVERALSRLAGFRRAEPGEFTRRAFLYGRIDLAEAEGLADLLAAETELQRRTAMAMAAGHLSRRIDEWRERLLGLSAQVEAALDFSDEEDAAEFPPAFPEACMALAFELEAWLARPRAEALRDGFRVVLAGPPNVGKSTLFNALTQSEAAITSPIPGTTRDVITRAVAIDGVPLVFVDTAGVRRHGADAIEQIGIARAVDAAEAADLVLWLGDGEAPRAAARAWTVAAQIDRPGRVRQGSEQYAVSAHTGEGMAALRDAVVAAARTSLPRPGEAALNQRQHELLTVCHGALRRAAAHGDPLLVGEELRAARSALDRLVGRAGTEQLLDAVFSRFCIGK